MRWNGTLRMMLSKRRRSPPLCSKLYGYFLLCQMVSAADANSQVAVILTDSGLTDQLARYFLENLGDAAEQSLEGLHAFQQDIGSIIPGMFDQYRMYLAESFESLRRMVHAEYEGEVWRKRRRGERSSDLSCVAFLPFAPVSARQLRCTD